MNLLKPLFTSTLLLLPLISCAEDHENTTFNKNQSTQVLAMNQSNDLATNQSENRTTKLLPSGDILTLAETENGSPSASYFSCSPAERTELAKRMLNILKSTKASKSIIAFAESSLNDHPRLKRSRFKVPLTDDDGTVYKFTYSSDIESNLYILNYQYIGASKS